MKTTTKYIVIVLLLIMNFTVYSATDTNETARSLEIQRQMDAKTSQSDEGLEVKYLENGMKYIDLKGRFQNFSKIKMVDGKQVFICNGDSNHTHSHNAKKQQPVRTSK